MSKEKQMIEEMAKDLACNICWDEDEIPTINCLETATRLFIKGYRKQSEGEWTYGVDREGTMKCTLCRRRIPKIEHARYCPNCGAKMKGGGE